jgi:hypothetical protein
MDVLYGPARTYAGLVAGAMRQLEVRYSDGSLREISPSGICGGWAWGYSGGSPMMTAATILADAIGEPIEDGRLGPRVKPLCQTFASVFLARVKEGHSFELPGELVLLWVLRLNRPYASEMH